MKILEVTGEKIFMQTIQALLQRTQLQEEWSDDKGVSFFFCAFIFVNALSLGATVLISLVDRYIFPASGCLNSESFALLHQNSFSHFIFI